LNRAVRSKPDPVGQFGCEKAGLTLCTFVRVVSDLGFCCEAMETGYL